ncbi:MAG: helix-turn-helix domain-containing protein [Cyclobacteriaceae bacterium]|jgi:predicted HTH transcriptional regulator
MDFISLKKLVQSGETDQVEFKRKVRHPEKIVRELVAFANTKGGELFIGVNDDLSIPGLQHPDEDDFLMQKSIRELCRPSLYFVSTIIPISDSRGIVHITVPESESKPHYALKTKNQRWGTAYVRVDDKSLQASRELCQILKLTKRNHHHYFSYGEKEKQLMNYLGEHEFITLNTFIEAASIKRREASDILVNLTLSNALKIIPKEGEDWFVHVD